MDWILFKFLLNRKGNLLVIKWMVISVLTSGDYIEFQNSVLSGSNGKCKPNYLFLSITIELVWGLHEAR
jgi:hypothetical protein